MNDTPLAAPTARKRFYRDPTFQVLAAIVLGGLLGAYFPDTGKAMKPLGDMFIRMIKMVIGPIIFLTIVTGIAHVGDVKKVGKIGTKAIIYFEVVTTLALMLGMLSMNILKPGIGFDRGAVAGGDISKYTSKAHETHGALEFMMDIVPGNIVGAFAEGNLLQILFISILFGAALSGMGERGIPITQSFDKYGALIFRAMYFIMKLAPIGAFGAVAFTVGNYGTQSIIPLLKLLLLACGTLLFFIFIVLGAITRFYGFSIVKFVRYLKDELIVVIGTGSSEAVLPRMMEKMQAFGCSQQVTGLVLPTGYAFNLAGSSLYLSMCVLFIAQAYGIDLSLSQQFSILGILLLTSKGAAGVVGSAFIVLAASIEATGFLPIEGVALLLGIDRFMSSIRAMTNLIGNGVATVIVAKSEKEFDEAAALIEYRHAFEDEHLKSI